MLYYRCQDMTAVWLNSQTLGTKKSWNSNIKKSNVMQFPVHTSGPLTLYIIGLYIWNVYCMYVLIIPSLHVESRCRPYLRCPWWRGPYATEIKWRLNRTATAVVMKDRPELIFLNRKVIPLSSFPNLIHRCVTSHCFSTHDIIFHNPYIQEF